MREPRHRIAALGLLAGLFALGCGDDTLIRPNLVLVTVEGLRADRLGCYGGGHGLGVEVCDIGEAGARYVWAFSSAPSGAPAGASLLTSQYPSRHGLADNAATFLRSDSETLAETLQRAGYTTAAFVASPELNRSRNFQQGFDEFVDGALPRRSNAETEGVGDTEGDEIDEGHLLSDHALAWVEDTRRPFFLWIHFSEPHGPFSLRSKERGEGRSDERDDGRGGDTVAAKRFDSIDEAYDDSIRRLDRTLSQLIAVLDAATEERELGLMLVGLHGQSLGERGVATGHGSALDLEQIRVPLLWRPPRAGPGRSVARRITTPVSILDVAPTLLGAAALPAPATFEGEVLPYGDAAESESAAPRALFAEHEGEYAVVLGSQYAAISVSYNPPPPSPYDPPEALPDNPALAALAETEDGVNEAPTAVVVSKIRTALLWPEHDRSREGLPEYDRGETQRRRWRELGPHLADFSGEPALAP